MKKLFVGGVFTLALGAVFLSACTSSFKLGGASSSGGPSSGGSESFEMPNLVGLSADEARKKLLELGVTSSIDTTDNQCDGDEERATVPVGHVCRTAPAAGQQTGPKTPKTLHLVSPPNFSVMPDVAGKTEAEARKILGAAGFQKVDVDILDQAQVPAGCAPATTCWTTPEPGTKRAMFKITKTLHLAPLPGQKPGYYDTAPAPDKTAPAQPPGSDKPASGSLF